MVFAGHHFAAYLTKLYLLFNHLISSLAVKKGKLPVIRQLNAQMIGYACRLALAAKNTGVGVMNHQTFGDFLALDLVLMGNGRYRTNFLASQTTDTFLSVKLRLSTEIWMGLMLFFREFGSIRPDNERFDGFLEFP